jgi:hypothetical protein
MEIDLLLQPPEEMRPDQDVDFGRNETDSRL